MKIIRKTLLCALIGSALISCTATSESTTPTQALAEPSTPKVIDAPAVNPGAKGEISLEKIMSDPDWLGRQPQAAYWSDDSKGIYFERKRAGVKLDDLFFQSADSAGNGVKVPLADLHQASYRNRIVNHDRSQAAWLFEGNLFVKDLTNGEIRQLTRGSMSIRQLAYMANGRLSFRDGDKFIAIDPTTGISEVLASWSFSEAPTAVKPAADYIAAEQQRLIRVIADRRATAEARFAQRQALMAENATVTTSPFYLGKGQELVTASLSPNGQWAILVTQKPQSWRAEGDIMPNYINEDGRISSERVRRRVADAKPVNQQLVLLDLTNGTQHSLSYAGLPGYNEDVLAAVKQENAEAKGETYTPNRVPREIGILPSWPQSAIQWHQQGDQVAMMLEAWDNKDRWLVTVDLANKQLQTQERLHDDAWINYRFNSFGWLNQTATLYYLSERSGYAHLYLQKPGQEARALTSGKYEVDQLTLSHDDQFIYFQANKVHPGIYEIYRVNLQDGQLQQLTRLNGMTDYQLSPDETRLLLTHSTTTMPPELYVQAVDSQQAMRLTHTVSDEFLALPWVAPDIVPVPSSHTDEPIYSRVYRPAEEGTSPRRAVIFNHGAGYLQNAHLGWSGYFREFMFHSLLVQQGYVVMDMDYRASKGYGRDWRTAIYRQMGTPETQDLVDGVNWLVSNANVDRQRIGTYGGSYGGFMTFMALFTEPELFQAGAALRPVTDWAHYNTGYTSNILNTPDVDPIAYERSSPIYFAEGLTKPLLINAPMVDDNVFFVDVVRLVQRLIELEKQDFETAIFPVEPHGFIEPSSWLDEYRRIYALFEDNL